MTWSSDWLPPSPPTAKPGAPHGPSAWSLTDLEPMPQAPEPGAQHALAEPPKRDPAAERAAAEERARAARQAELEEAWNRGFDAGFMEAGEQQAGRVTSALQALETAVSALQSGQSAWTDNAREHIVALATAVARHVIGRELRGDPYVIADLTRRALAHFPLNEPVRVRVNPEDLSILSAAISPDGGNIHVAPGRDVQWVADARIEVGGCIVEGRRRVVDGRVDHALERIFQRLADD